MASVTNSSVQPARKLCGCGVLGEYVCGGCFTSHVLLALIDNKCVSAMLLLLLVWLLVLVGVGDNADLCLC